MIVLAVIDLSQTKYILVFFTHRTKRLEVADLVSEFPWTPLCDFIVVKLYIWKPTMPSCCCLTCTLLVIILLIWKYNFCSKYLLLLFTCILVSRLLISHKTRERFAILCGCYVIYEQGLLWQIDPRSGWYFCQ